MGKSAIFAKILWKSRVFDKAERSKKDFWLVTCQAGRQPSSLSLTMSTLPDTADL